MRSLHIFIAVRVKDGDVGLVFLIEIQRLCAGIAAYGIAYRCHDNLPDGLLVVEFYLGLYGMYVDVDALRVHREIQEI